MSESLNEVRDRLALEYSKAYRHMSTFEHFSDGFDAALAEVLRRIGEFDEASLKNHDRLHFQYENGVGEHGIRYRCLREGARYQHSEILRKLGLG